MPELNATAHKILDTAQHYTQLKGFNAFSYKDIQSEVGVKTSSIHYYFPTKQDLAIRMIERYTEQFQLLLGDIAQQHDSGLKRIEALGQVYLDGVKQEKFCLCGMLASDMLGLPEAVHAQLSEFFQVIEQWLMGALELVQSQSNKSSDINIQRQAAYFLSALEGGMLIARVQKRPEYLNGIIEEFLKQLRS